MDIKLKRNIALIGHAHSGKTSLSESMLFACGTISRKGDVMQGNALSDFNDDEKDRQISINSSLLNANYNKHQIQIIDAPGYLDFVGETISAMSICDAAVLVVDACNGVEVGTEDGWQRAEDRGIPRIIFINKIEKEGANLDQTLADIKEQLSPKAMVVDLASSDLVEAVAESDDALLEKYLDQGSLSEEEVKGALRKAVVDAKLFPIITGSALQDQGIKELLDAIIAYLPSPLEGPAMNVIDSESKELKPFVVAEDGPFAGFIFKTMFDPHLGQLTLMRILRGALNPNYDCFNPTRNTKEHVGTMSMLQGKEQTNMSQGTCGDIVALPKLKNAHVSDTLCDNKEKLIFAPIIFPEPSISASIKPKTRADEEKISTSLHKLCEGDKTFCAQRNDETKELIISGVGDLHLKVMLDRMESRYHVEVELGKPKVTYRETITKTGNARHKYKKQSGGRGQYGDVALEIAPLDRESDQYEFVNKIFGGAIPRNYIPSVEKGVFQTIKDGVLAGYPIHNMQVTVVDGSYHEVDSSDMAFQIAGSLALKEAVKSAGPILLEPIMEVSVVVPSDFIGQISGDVSSRRGRIMGSESKGKKEVIKAHIPLSEMFKYATDLRSMTGGRGSYTMKMSHYEAAPSKITEQVIAESKKE